MARSRIILCQFIMFASCGVLLFYFFFCFFLRWILVLMHFWVNFFRELNTLYAKLEARLFICKLNNCWSDFLWISILFRWGWGLIVKVMLIIHYCINVKNLRTKLKSLMIFDDLLKHVWNLKTAFRKFQVWNVEKFWNF